MNIAVLFDEENQQRELALLKSWKLEQVQAYVGYTIKDEQQSLGCLQIAKDTLFVILIGESTRFLGAQFIAHIKLIIDSKKAILCLNISGTIGLNEADCPRLLWDCGAIHMPFDKENVYYSLGVIKLDSRESNSTGSFHFRMYTRPYDIE